MESNNDSKKLTVVLEHDLWRLCSLHKIDTGESIASLIVRLLTEYFTDKKLAEK